MAKVSTRTKRSASSRPAVLIPASRLARRVEALGREISRDYRGRSPLVLGVLQGAFVFAADLVRRLTIPCGIDFIRLSSYRGTTSTGRVRFEAPPRETVRGRHVLVVEDIVDTGLTARALLARLREEGARSVALCSLLRKPSRAKVAVPIRYLGFDVPDVFVVGYGLDCDGRHRNLGYVGVLSGR